MIDSSDLETMGYVICATSLERKRSPGIPTGECAGRNPHHQFKRGMRPIGQFNHDEGDMDTLAKSILRRMRKNRHITGVGSYLLGDEDGKVYVVAEGNSTGMGFVNRHESWHIGRYCAGLRGALPLVEQLIGDLQEHFKGRIGEVAA